MSARFDGGPALSKWYGKHPPPPALCWSFTVAWLGSRSRSGKASAQSGARRRASTAATSFGAHADTAASPSSASKMCGLVYTATGSLGDGRKPKTWGRSAPASARVAICARSRSVTVSSIAPSMIAYPSAASAPRAACSASAATLIRTETWQT